MKKVRIGVFGYNFPHKKTQDILLRLFLYGYEINWVFLAEPIKLNIPTSSIRTKIRHSALIEPQIIVNKLNFNMHIGPHNDEKVANIIKKNKLDIGVIAGARILKKNIIDSFNIGIINFHPGLIPEARGLDALLWSIYKEIPLGITAHLIDEQIDAGNVLIKEKIDIYSDDSIFDVSERLYEKQLQLINPAIEAAIKGKMIEVKPQLEYNGKMPEEIERIVQNLFPAYIKKFANK